MEYRLTRAERAAAIARLRLPSSRRSHTWSGWPSASSVHCSSSCLHRREAASRFGDRHVSALRIREDPIAERNEFGARLRKRSDLLHAAREADTGNLEQFRPPRYPLDYRLERRTVLPLIRLAKHHVVGAGLRDGHGVMAGLQPAAA